MDFPGLPGYRPPHPQDTQNMPPPVPPNYPSQNMGPNNVFPSTVAPPRMPLGYPPMNEAHLPAGFGMDQGMQVNFHSGSMQNTNLPPGFHSQLGNPMSAHLPQNIHNFQSSSQRPTMSPPNFHQHQRNMYHPHSQHQQMNDFHQRYHHTRLAHNPMIGEFHPHQQGLDYHSRASSLAQDFHGVHPNQIVADYHQQDFSHQDPTLAQQEYQHGGQSPQNIMGAYVDHNAMGMQNLMNDHGMMSQLDGHMLGGGDAFSQHQLMQMYGDTTLQEGVFIPLGCQLMDKVDNASITCVNFDGQQELLWAGNERGYVASYYGTEFLKYSAFRVHDAEDVRMNLSFPQGVLSLTPNYLRGTLRRGISVFSFKDPHLHDMTCMFMKGDTSVLIGGHHKQVLELDIHQNRLSNVFEVKDSGIAIFRGTERYICGGDSTGKVTIYDAKTMRAEHTLDAHSSCLSDFDIHENLLITCGFSNRMNSFHPDRLLMVYDMRVMRAMAPIQVSNDPTFLRFLTPMSLVVVSQMGSFQIVGTASGSAPNSHLLYPVETNGAYIVAFDMSPSHQTLAFGDSSGNIHLYSNPNGVFNLYSEPTELSDTTDTYEPIDISDKLAVYSAIPMQYPPQGPLVSDFPEEMLAQAYREQQPIDPEILRSMKMYQNIGYAPNPNQQKRNVVPYNLNDKGNKDKNACVPESPIGRGEDPFMTVPKRYQRVEIKYSKLGVEDFDFRHYNKTNLAGLEPHIPNAYCNSMLQVLYYIEPLRCALLGHVCNKEFCLSCELGFLFHMLDQQKGNTCQATNFLRAFRTMPQVSALGLVLHDADESSGRVDFPRLIQSWQRFVLMQIHAETCVPVESFDKPSVDLKTDESNEKKQKKKVKKNTTDAPETSEADKDVAADKEEGDNCEEDSDEPESPMTRSIIRDLLGINIKSSLQCKCGLTSERTVDGTHINLMYPECRPIGLNSSPLFVSFAEVVQHSMTAATNTQAWCSACNRYQHHCQRKRIQNLPDVLALNCHTENEKNLDFWKTQFQIIRQRHKESAPAVAIVKPTQSTIKCRFGMSCHRPDCRFQHDSPRPCELEAAKKQPQEDDVFGPSWIPLGLKIVRNQDGSVDVTEISDEEPLPSQQKDDVRYYELYSVVSHVLSNSGGNLVCCLKVGEKYHQRKERVTCTQWYLINDFCITPVEKDEAVDFKLDWNVPCIIHYTRRDFVQMHDLKIQNWSTPEVFFNDNALLNPERHKLTFLPLQRDELPKSGDIVALDAEFVSLKEEEAELRSDGTRSTLVPTQMSVARITCLRGSGPNKGEPFIDDYIVTQEQVVDYLTQYSGIKPGDLDPNVSTKYLTTLKATYLKLRYLIDNGVIFVGHGLKKDFRVINIGVPKGQVMDTVDLFHLPKQRYISLKFLAWYYLKICIQSYTHDSVEDARTALKLYSEYLRLKEESQDKVISAIKELYEAGRKISWVIPDVADKAGEDVAGEADFL